MRKYRRVNRGHFMNERLEYDLSYENIPKNELSSIGAELDTWIDDFVVYLCRNVFKYQTWGYTEEELKGVLLCVLQNNFRGVKDNIIDYMWNVMQNMVED